MVVCADAGDAVVDDDRIIFHVDAAYEMEGLLWFFENDKALENFDEFASHDEAAETQDDVLPWGAEVFLMSDKVAFAGGG